MTRDEIEQQVKKYFDKLPYPENWEIVEFALSIHDAVKKEDIAELKLTKFDCALRRLLRGVVKGNL